MCSIIIPLSLDVKYKWKCLKLMLVLMYIQGRSYFMRFININQSTGKLCFSFKPRFKFSFIRKSFHYNVLGLLLKIRIELRIILLIFRISYSISKLMRPKEYLHNCLIDISNLKLCNWRKWIRPNESFCFNTFENNF